MEVTREMARTMAAWWGKKVSGRGSHHDNGDNGIASFLSGLLADGMNKPADESAVNKFVDILTEKILKQAETNPYTLRHYLHCDYAPSQFLSDAAKEAGIDPSNFPWKTAMSIDENKDGESVAMVSNGYRAEWVQIWPVEKEEATEETEKVTDVEVSQNSDGTGAHLHVNQDDESLTIDYDIKAEEIKELDDENEEPEPSNHIGSKSMKWGVRRNISDDN